MPVTISINAYDLFYFRNMMIIISLFVFLVSYHIIGNDAAKILAISWVPSDSHHKFFEPIWRELSFRGHQVTVITSRPMRDKTLMNITEIDVSSIFEVRDRIDAVKYYSKDNWSWNIQIFWKNLLESSMDTMLGNNDVKVLINSNAEFDLICVEAHHPIVYAFGERFRAPVVGECTIMLDDLIDV